jgi:hypothetical protein
MSTVYNRRPINLMTMLLFGCTLYGCAQQKEPMTIRPFAFLNHIDTTIDMKGQKQLAKFEYFIANHFDYSKEATESLDQWVQKNKAADAGNFIQYTVYVYKKSSVTNEEHLKENPRDLDRYSLDNDWIYEGTWMNGKFVNRYIVKDGTFLTNGDSPINVETKTKKSR